MKYLNFIFAFLMVAVFVSCTGNQERRVRVTEAYVDSCNVNYGPHVITLYGKDCNPDVLNEERSTGEENSQRAEDENLEKTDQAAEKQVSKGEEGKDAAEETPGNVTLDMNKCRKLCPTEDPVTRKISKHFRNAEDALKHAYDYNVECFEKGVDGEKGAWTPLRPIPKGKEPFCIEDKKGDDSAESQQEQEESAEDQVVIKVKGDVDVSECFSLKHIHDYMLENRQPVASHSKMYGFDVLNDQGQSAMDQVSKEVLKKLHTGVALRTGGSRISSSQEGSAQTAVGINVDQSSEIGTMVVQPADETLVQLDEFVGRIVSCKSKREMIIKNFYGDGSGDECELYSGNKVNGACEFREYSWNGHGLNSHEDGEDGRIMLVRKGRFVANEETKESLWYKAWHYIYWTKNDPSYWENTVPSQPDLKGHTQLFLLKAQKAAEDGDGNFEAHSEKWKQFLRLTNDDTRPAEEIREEEKTQQKAAEEYREQKGI